MSEIHIIATIRPRPGKLARVEELLQVAIAIVEITEPSTTRYQMYREVEREVAEVIMVETYKSQTDNDVHVASKGFKELFDAFEKEDLLACGVKVAKCRIAGGFDRR